jgi:NADPH:quinone reductase-like Zn-dependent oxidoreductase
LHARTFPLVLGYDFSGVVDKVGSGVQGLERGAEVFGFLAYGPFNREGAFAEMLIARADRLARKPAEVTHAQAAAAATPALTALQSIRDLGRVRGSGMRVVVTGISGGVGSFGVAIARRLGATVIAIGSGSGLARATALGAARVIDRTAGDPLAAVGEPVDLVLDAAAAYRWRSVRGCCAPAAPTSPHCRRPRSSSTS